MVSINDQVRIGHSNFRIALEKPQSGVIYKLCLAILRQYSFFNAFIATADAPEIYMQQFWHTVAYTLETKSYTFTWDDQSFEVNADLLLKAHVIKLDVVLGNLKFANNGAKDPIYGMAIPLEMMSNEVKAFADYLDYLAKSKRETPVKVRGKDSEDTKDKEEIQLIQRQNGVVIGKHAYKDSDEHDLDHSKKLKGIETLYEAAQFMINMKKLRKASKDDFILQQRSKGSCKGSGVILEVPDDSSDRFDRSSSESEDQERFLTTDDDKSDTDAGKTMGEKQDMDEQARSEQVANVQAKVIVPKPQVKKPAV
ncbi:hypothetical protein Tco_0138595 [Tanacetum coccineum]